jgi:uncharacterized membrane protein
MKTWISLRYFPADLFALSGLPILAFALLVSALLSLQGWSWVIAYCIAISVAIAGALFLFRAKFPLYRRGRFFTFGIVHIPESLRRTYRRGCRLSIAGITFALLLLGMVVLRKGF